MWSKRGSLGYFCRNVGGGAVIPGFRFQLLGYTCPVWPVALEVSKDALGGASGGAGDPKTETGTKKESEVVDDEKAPRSSPVFRLSPHFISSSGCVRLRTVGRTLGERP